MVLARLSLALLPPNKMANYSSNVSFSGDDKAEADAIERQRRLSEALTTTSMKPIQSSNPASAVSYTQGLAQMLQAYYGRKGQEYADTRAKALGTQQDERRAADTALLAQALQGRQAQPAGIAEDAAGNVTQSDPMAARTPQQGALQALPMMRDPAMQQIAMQHSIPKQPEPFTLAPGATRYGPDGKPVATAPVAPKSPEPFTLAPGAIRYGPDGKQIASSPVAQRPISETTVNLGKDDDEYLKARRKAQAESFQTLEKGAESAYKGMQAVDRFIASSKTGMQGGAAPLITATKNFLSTFGYPVGDLKDTRVMEQTIGQILGTKMQELGARGLTDKDMAILREALPRVEVDAASREAVASILKKDYEATIKEYIGARDEEARIYPDFAKKTPTQGWLREYKGRKPPKQVPGSPPQGIDPALWNSMPDEDKALWTK